MTHDALKQMTFDANMELASSGLVMGTFGNLSAVDRGAGVFAIKPSGVPYDALTPDHMVVVSLESGAVVGGTRRPSSARLLYCAAAALNFVRIATRRS